VKKILPNRPSLPNNLQFELLQILYFQLPSLVIL
jgi:hypothetical protein